MKEVVIKAKPRDKLGKEHAKKMRKNGDLDYWQVLR